MIKITRSQCPAALLKKAKGTLAYKNKNVVSALWKMQHEKCCYCEQHIPEKGHQKAVEHFRPQSIFRGIKNDWRNLLLACPQCNGSKSNKFPIQLTDNPDETKAVYICQTSRSILIDPSDGKINPQKHIDFSVNIDESICGLAIPRKNSKRGKTTIKITGLYDVFHTKKRNLFIIQLYDDYIYLMHAYAIGEEEIVENRKLKFELSMSSKSEFAGVTRAFVRTHKLDERFAMVIPEE